MAALTAKPIPSCKRERERGWPHHKEQRQCCCRSWDRPISAKAALFDNLCEPPRWAPSMQHGAPHRHAEFAQDWTRRNSAQYIVDERRGPSAHLPARESRAGGISPPISGLSGRASTNSSTTCHTDRSRKRAGESAASASISDRNRIPARCNSTKTCGPAAVQRD